MQESKRRYPNTYEIEQTLSEFCSRSYVERFAKQRGIFVFKATQEELAKNLSKFFFEDSDLEAIRKAAYQGSSTKKLSGFIISSKRPNFNPLDELEKLRQFGASKPGIHLGAMEIPDSNSADSFSGDLEYERSKPGRIEFLQREPRNVDYRVTKNPDGSFQFYVEADSSADAKKFEDFITNSLEEIDIEGISLDLLTSPQTIQFFDDLSVVAMGTVWALVQVKRLIFRRGAESEETEAEATAIGVINQAILEGQNLRNNEFVKECEEAGYRFSSMTFEFENKNEGYFLELRAEFKLKPVLFEIHVENYHKVELDEGGEPQREKADLEVENEFEIITNAWNQAKTIHANLIQANATDTSSK
jgi:hypothetical protein